MKNFLLALTVAVAFAIFFGAGQRTEAATVNLCDFTLGQFIDRYNFVANAAKFPTTVKITTMPKANDSFRYKNYTVYSTFLGDEGHGVIFMLFTDRQNRVAEIGLIFGYEDELSSLARTMILFSSFFAVGMDETEIKSLAGQLSSSNSASVWCNKLNRRIYLTQTYAPNGHQGLLQMNLYAER